MKDHDKDLFRQLLYKDNSKYDMSRVKEFLDMFLPLPATTGAIDYKLCRLDVSLVQITDDGIIVLYSTKILQFFDKQTL